MTDELNSKATHAWGYGLVTKRESDGVVLDTWFPEPQLGRLPENKERWIVPAEIEAGAGSDPRRKVVIEPTTIEIELSQAPQDAVDAYLRLHLLSHLLVKPNSISLEGLFGRLSNVVWTNAGPIHPEDYRSQRLALQQAGISAHSFDKFPRLIDYVVPQGVRIGDVNRVRLGAHLAAGTTVMHEGFVNFNAGTLGTSMVEGRISQGVIVAENSDIGGGASIMGTLSGGGKQVVSIGQRSLLGANSGLGISIGDDCIIEAGLYLTAGSKVNLLTSVPGRADLSGTVKALELSGLNGLLFRRNSSTGAIEVLAKDGVGIELNPDLHKHN